MPNAKCLPTFFFSTLALSHYSTLPFALYLVPNAFYSFQPPLPFALSPFSTIFISMNRQTYIYSLILLLLTQAAYTQIIPFKNYTVHEGLPSNYVSGIVQDQKGYIWLSTNSGLSKFDGYQFETYTIENGLSDNFITCLTTDVEGQIWAGTETGGISIVSDNGVRIIDESHGLFPGSVDKIFTDKQNNVWACGRQEGVSIINEDSINTFTGENSILSTNVFCHLVDSKGTVWLGTYDAVYFYDSVLHQLDLPLLNDITVWDILEDQYKRIWIASEGNGVFCYDGETLNTYNEDNGLSTNTTLSLLEDKKGRILVGTYFGGINIIENSKINTSIVSATRDYWIWELYEDSKGRIWGRTDEQGVILINGNEIRNYSNGNNLVSPFVLNVFEDNYGNVWLTTKDGISVYGKTIFENYTKNFVADNSNIMTLHIDAQNNIYTGTYNGLTIITVSNEISTFSIDDGLPDDPSIFKIIQDTDKKNQWLATNGLSKLNNKTIKHFSIYEMQQGGEDIITKDIVLQDKILYGASEVGIFVFNTVANTYYFLNKNNGLIDNDIYSLETDNTGNIWCGSSSGLSVYDGKKFHNYTTLNGLPNNFCNDIAFDNNNVAWIATDFGLCSAVLSENYVLSTKNYFKKNGLSSNSISSVLSGSEGNIWIGHNKGVDCLNTITKQVKNYGKIEGFLPVENNLGAITKDGNGNIWFGTINGIVKYSPENDVENTQAPKIYIKGIQLYNDTSSIDEYYTKIDSSTLLPLDLKLHHSKRNIYFNYVGLHYTIVEKNTYKYRLRGYDDNWSAPTTDIQSIPYQKLPQGKYTFEVLAANCDGVWTEEPAKFSFEILPPFWKTWWFRIIEIVSVVLLLFLFIYVRERKLRHDKKVLTQKVKERTLEIEKQKDKIEIQHDEIVQQKKEITDSIKYAQHIQSAILPKFETISPLLKDYFILYKPRDIVSGDFYWVHGNKNKVIALAADCTGHGVPGAFMSMLGVSILNEIATKDSNIKAEQILDTLREHIITTLSHTSKDEEARDGMDIALSIIDFQKYTVEFAGAYNPLILVRNGEAEVYKADKMPVGLHSGDLMPFSSQEIQIQKGDCLYMFSDGYADQFGGPDGKKFMSGTFRKLLVEISPKPMNEQHQILNETIVEWMTGFDQIDDILVMGVRIV
jgi:ligand-binding sensor domain-containing protein/serine phosphatase RsbU (regulator of sigma subunit)